MKFKSYPFLLSILHRSSVPDTRKRSERERKRERKRKKERDLVDWIDADVRDIGQIQCFEVPREIQSIKM
jgi:hypothetical protein